MQGRVVQEACSLNVPLHVTKGRTRLPFESFIAFDQECVELDAVKKTEDGKYIAVRFHDFTGGSHKLTMKTGFGWKQSCLCDLRERPLEDWKENGGSGEISLTVKPYEIVTMLFEV